MWTPPKGEVATTYAIASDLSGVIATDDGFGIFKTETEAHQSLILRLESDISSAREVIKASRRRMRHLARKGTP